MSTGNTANVSLITNRERVELSFSIEESFIILSDKPELALEVDIETKPLSLRRGILFFRGEDAEENLGEEYEAIRLQFRLTARPEHYASLEVLLNQFEESRLEACFGWSGMGFEELKHIKITEIHIQESRVQFQLTADADNLFPGDDGNDEPMRFTLLCNAQLILEISRDSH